MWGLTIRVHLIYFFKENTQVASMFWTTVLIVSRGSFLEKPGNLTGPKSCFEIKASRKVGRVLTSSEVSFVSLADNFTEQFSNLLKLSSGMENQTA